MKKSSLRALTVLLALCLCFSLFGCGKKTDEPAPTEPEFVWDLDLGSRDPSDPEKVIFIMVDGMRPDVLEYVPQYKTMQEKAYYTLNAKTMIPPITLPVHVSIFYSLSPEVHGVIDNSYITFDGNNFGDPDGEKNIYDIVAEAGMSNAMIYSWSLLRDLFDGQDNIYTYRVDSGVTIGDAINEELTVEALNYIALADPDFTFLYLGHPDSMGHTYEWMSEEYITAICNSWERIQRVVDAYGKTHTIIVASDHGGHNKGHGKDIPEDMTVPLFIISNRVAPGLMPEGVTVLDIMPTVADLFGLEAPEYWEGKSLLP